MMFWPERVPAGQIGRNIRNPVKSRAKNNSLYQNCAILARRLRAPAGARSFLLPLSNVGERVSKARAFCAARTQANELPTKDLGPSNSFGEQLASKRRQSGPSSCPHGTSPLDREHRR